MTDWAWGSVDTSITVDKFVALWNQRGLLLQGALSQKEDATGARNILRNGAAPGRESGAAIQAALNASDSVYVPFTSTPFYTSQTLLLNDNNRLYGPGKIVATTALNTVIQAVGKTNVHVSGIGVEGTLAALPTDLIQLKTCTFSSVRRTRVRYALHEGISLNQSTYGCDVVGNLIRDISGSIGWGIGLFWDIQRCRVLGNTILDCGAYGIVIDDGTSGQTDNLPCYRNIVALNTIETATTNMWGMAVEGSSENVVALNTFNVPLATYGLDIGYSNSTTVFAPQNNNISTNFIRAKTGVRLSGSQNRVVGNVIDGSDSGVVLDQSSGLASVANEVDDNTILGQTTGNKRAIQCSNANFSNTKIRRNKLLSTTAQWSVLHDLGTGATIADNEAQVAYSVIGTGHSFDDNKLNGKFVREAFGADNGDTSPVLATLSPITQQFNTQLTANRTVTLPITNNIKGQRHRIIRNAGTPGAFTLTVQDATPTTLKAIPINTNATVEAEYDDSGAGQWRLVGYQPL